MQLEYNSIYGQSLFDLCLNTVGTIDRLGQFMKTNGLTTVSFYPDINTSFIFDSEDIYDVLVYNLKQVYTTSAIAEMLGVVLIDETSSANSNLSNFIPLLSEDGYYLIPE